MRPASIWLIALLVGASASSFAEPAVGVQSSPNARGLGMDGLGTSSTHIVKIAGVSVSTASAGGFTLSIGSAELTKAGGHPVTFQVALVDRDASAPSSGAFTAISGSAYTFSTNVAGGVEKDLYIKYHPAALQDPGAYAATVELDVVDN